MEDFLKFLLIAGVILVGIFKEVNKNSKSKKAKNNRPVPPTPSPVEVAPDATPMPEAWGRPRSLEELFQPIPAEQRTRKPKVRQQESKPKKKKEEVTIRSSAAEYLTYVASVGDQQDSVEMRYEDENIWLTQKMMATLYNVDVRTINEHIKKIYSDSELEEDSTIRNFRIVQTEGSRQVTRDTKHYNLQMIIAVGFKVNSERAVQFRKWANLELEESAKK